MKKRTYTKCTGCLALKTKKTSFECSLGIPIESNVVNKQIINPKPSAPCFNPKTASELKEAKGKNA